MTWGRRRVVSIVEGLGEELAVPRLVERWIRQHGLFRAYVADEPAICSKGVGRLKCAPGHQRGVEYFVKVALARSPSAVLIVLDADEECLRRVAAGREPLGVEIFRRARESAPPDVSIAVVVADREFEAWFVEHRLALGLPEPEAWTGAATVESIADCKKVVGRMLGRRYDPVLDQAALAARLPLFAATSPEVARGGRSYRKLIASLDGLMPPPACEAGGEADVVGPTEVPHDDGEPTSATRSIGGS